MTSSTVNRTPIRYNEEPDPRYFGSGPCLSWAKGELKISTLPVPPPDPEVKPIAPVVVMTKAVPKPKPRATPAAKKAHRRTRTSITPRDRAVCDHMEDGKTIWTKDGTEPHGARRQRYKCGSCQATGFLVDGVMLPVKQAVKLVPDFPDDMRSWLVATAASKGVTEAELFSDSRLQRIVDARRYIALCLRSRNLTLVQIGKALGITSSSVQYLVTS